MPSICNRGIPVLNIICVAMRARRIRFVVVQSNKGVYLEPDGGFRQ